MKPIFYDKRNCQELFDAYTGCKKCSRGDRHIQSFYFFETILCYILYNGCFMFFTERSFYKKCVSTYREVAHDVHVCIAAGVTTTTPILVDAKSEQYRKSFKFCAQSWVT
jgi:hypothetical protein